MILILCLIILAFLPNSHSFRSTSELWNEEQNMDSKSIPNAAVNLKNKTTEMISAIHKLRRLLAYPYFRNRRGRFNYNYNKEEFVDDDDNNGMFIPPMFFGAKMISPTLQEDQRIVSPCSSGICTSVDNCDLLYPVAEPTITFCFVRFLDIGICCDFVSVDGTKMTTTIQHKPATTAATTIQHSTQRTTLNPPTKPSIATTFPTTSISIVTTTSADPTHPTTTRSQISSTNFSIETESTGMTKPLGTTVTYNENTTHQTNSQTWPATTSAITIETTTLSNEPTTASAIPVVKNSSWLVNIHINQKSGIRRHQCVGSIISNMYILTAAHCVQGFLPADLTVEVFDNGIERTYLGKLLRVQTMHIHPFYTYIGGNQLYNAAVLKLEEEFAFTKYVLPIKLPKEDPSAASLDKFDGEILTLIGFERGKHGMANSECSRQLPNSYISQAHLCAARTNLTGSGICSVDSGGPLQIKDNDSWLQIGIVGYSHGCSKPEVPCVFARVSSFANWINQVTML